MSLTLNLMGGSGSYGRYTRRKRWRRRRCNHYQRPSVGISYYTINNQVEMVETRKS
jgi:hypothetical protein